MGTRTASPGSGTSGQEFAEALRERFGRLREAVRAVLSAPRPEPVPVPIRLPARPAVTTRRPRW